MSYRDNPPTIPNHALIWDEIGTEENPRSRLLAHIDIAGMDMHLEAIEVDEDMNAIYPARDDDLGTLMNMEECRFRTLEIEGREYVLYATPYGE